MKSKLIKSLITLGMSISFLTGCSLLPSGGQNNNNNNSQEQQQKEEKIYTITWKNWDDSVLEVDTDVPEGTTPTYDGPTPTRESDNNFDYSFNTWYPAPSPARKDTTYTARFLSARKINTYTITWKNWDGKVFTSVFFCNFTKATIESNEMFRG